MIQFSRPKKSLAAAMDPFRRHETAATEFLDKGRVPGPAPSRFDPTYYRTHNATSFVPADAQSVVSQAVSAFPLFSGGSNPYGAGGKNKSFAGYASSITSQQAPEADSHEATAPTIAFSQYDRLGEAAANGDRKPRRRLSGGSIAPSDAPTASMYAFGYKAGDDDTQSIAPSQAGMTEF